MKRFSLLIILLVAGLSAAAQNSPKYEQFKELRNQPDTLGMKQMLDNWGEKDFEYYAAWTNYCQVMGNETQDPTWFDMAVNWARMGREDYPDNELLLHKEGESLFDSERLGEALPVLEEIEKRGLGDVVTWYQLSVIYGAKGDFAQSRRYLEKMIQEGDEDDKDYAHAIIATYDEIEHQADFLAFRPDHSAIEKLSKKPEFQQLVNRFEACDTTLTRDEIATVYYGSSYLKDYNLVQQQCEEIRTLADEDKIEEAKSALEAKLKEYPVSLFVLLSLFNLSENEEELQSYAWKVGKILAVIDNTGKLDNLECPFQVICVADEYRALDHLFGMTEFKSQAALEGLADDPLDKIVFLNEFGLEMTVYFQLTPPYWERLNRMFSGND